MKHTNKKTLVAGIVVCAVSSIATASNNSSTVNELSLNEVKFVAQQENEASASPSQKEDSKLLKKEISVNDGIQVAGIGVRTGKARHNPGISEKSFWDRFFS